MKSVVGFEGRYSVTPDGKVWSDKRSRWLIAANHKGYARVNLSRDGVAKCLLVHRLVAEAYLENPQNLPDVNHLNCVKADNRVANLEWCSHADNCRHAKLTGRYYNWPRARLCGERNGRSKLTREQVDRIRITKGTLSNAEAAREFGVDRANISRIRNGSKWK